MDDRTVTVEQSNPGARETKTSDVLLWLGVIALAAAISFGVSYLFIAIINPPPARDWAIMGWIFSIPSIFPVGKAPVNVWDISASLPFAFFWALNKIAIALSLLLFLVLLGVMLVPLLAMTALLAYMPWKFHFKARIGAGSMPARSARTGGD